MKTIIMKLGKCKLTLNISYISSVEIGATEDEITGFTEFDIPNELFKPLKNFYKGVNISRHSQFVIPPIDFKTWEEDYINDNEDSFRSRSADEFIYVMHYVLNNLKECTINIASQHIMWPIHDCYHALYDFVDKKFACSADTELIRVRQAVRVLKKMGIPVSKDYLKNWCEEYNALNNEYVCNGTYKYHRNPIRLGDVTTKGNVNDTSVLYYARD